MLHVDSEIVSSILADIDAEYENISKTTITQSKRHKYVRMTINYCPPGKVILSTVNYIGKIINNNPEDTRRE